MDEIISRSLLQKTSLSIDRAFTMLEALNKLNHLSIAETILIRELLDYIVYHLFPENFCNSEYNATLYKK